MPNHVTNRMRVTGDESEVSRFVDRAIRVEKRKNGDEEIILDFNRFIPMPEELANTTSGSVQTLGLALHGYDKSSIFDPEEGLVEIGKDRTLGRMLTYPWVVKDGITNIKDLEERLREDCPEADAAGRKAIRLYEAYGFIDWYDWSLYHWGTKWNAYDYFEARRDHGEFECLFNTAWSEPRKVFAAMCIRFPKLSFVFTWFDEGWCHAGELSRPAGGRSDAEIVVVESPDPETIPRDMELYIKTYGHSVNEDYV